MKHEILDRITNRVNASKRCHWVLLDPDDFSLTQAESIAKQGEDCGVDVILVGGSLLHTNHFDEFVASIKKVVKIPVVLFPGDSSQLSRHADAILFLSLISGRNPVNLIGEHVKAAPIIRECGIEPISTAYLLVESGTVTSVEFMSNTRPLPRTKPGIAAAHALAAQYMGMKLIYLEAGSGAQQTVPSEMIKMVKSYVEIPVIVGGGIRDSQTTLEKLKAGADIIVTGNVLGQEDGLNRMKEINKTIREF